MQTNNSDFTVQRPDAVAVDSNTMPNFSWGILRKEGNRSGRLVLRIGDKLCLMSAGTTPIGDSITLRAKDNPLVEIIPNGSVITLTVGTKLSASQS